ncbi:MAG: TrkA family potassium uptake protein [Myxococcales bacterium]|nr:TrkA family potassium uptake protein [Myxococcales bacterium]
MARQAIVIGLGQFGMSVARALSERGVEVFAVDVREERVRTASTFVAEAACFDGTDAEALSRTGPERRDVSVCAIGDEAKDASIICTALLRQIGAPRVIARANDDVHARILSLVGAHQVVNPELEFGERFASHILHRGIMHEMPLGEDLRITEVQVPSSFVGRTLTELGLPRRFGVMVVAVRRAGHGSVLLPDPTAPIGENDVLVVVANEGAVSRLMERS